MSTTQRNESLNNELKGYISVKYDMLTFFEHFDRLVGDKRYEEVKCDFRATQSTPKLKAELRILRYVAEVYTPAVYKIFEEEVMQTLNCDIFYCGEVDVEKVYKIKANGKHLEHVVRYSPLESNVKCSCKKFEFAGILCSHALKILDVNNIKSVPQQYILKRWTIDAKVLHISGNSNMHDDPRIKISDRYSSLCRMFVRIASTAAKSEETYSMSTNCAEKLAEDIEKFLRIRSDPDLDKSPSPQVGKENQMPKKPRGIKLKEKGIHGSARRVGGLEKASSQRKRKKKDDDVPDHVLEPQPEMQSQPPATVMGHLEVPSNQTFLHVSQYYAALEASTHPLFHTPISVTPESQGLHQGRPFQQFDTDFHNMFP
ncbi:hypothetical protein OsI_20324 [Oryza sativa Indica Group]|nr:hypothetical protein OsI_20324 [Oryza sativa Indica Group]